MEGTKKQKKKRDK